MLLAIDTATRTMSLAVHDGHALLAETTWHSANNHTIELAPTIETLLARCELTFADLDALAVSTGPGSYTGLRVGVALAKGLAAARHLPLVGITTLDTLAAAQPYYQGHGLVVIIEAGRGRIITATYRWSKKQWTQRGQPALMNWDELFESIDGPAVLTGDVSAAGREKIEARQSDDAPVQLIPAVFRLRRAGFLAQEALKKLDDDGPAAYPAAHVAPIYVKSSNLPASGE